MSKILKVRSVNDYGSYLGCPARHPLVCVIDYAEVSPIRHSLNNYGVYALFLRDDVGVELDYGCGRYDYNKGTLLCVAPGQVGGKEDNGERVSITGWALLFHSDLLRGTPLEKRIRDYSFFDYRVNEALHMSDREHDILVSLMRRMREELDNERDAQQDAILVGYIGLVLNFCQRFYNRQFQSREAENSDILVRFNRLLADYYEQQLQLKLGLPTVQYCADRLCLSPNYFGDVVKRTTGDTASNHIRRFVIRLAKNGLSAGESVAQVADRLGFEYPQHFSRMFRRQEGITPSEYSRKRRS
jgi:AraC-like DNA-binding protein